MEKNIKEALLSIVPNNNPKIELNHILVDSKNYVATDTIMLLTIEHGLKVDDKMLIVNQKAKYKINSEGIFDDELINHNMATSYPQYDRIIPKDGKHFDCNDNLINSLYRVSGEYGIMFDYVNFATRLKKLSKHLGDVDYILFVDHISYRDKNLPIKVVFKKYNAILVMMPYIPLGE